MFWYPIHVDRQYGNYTSISANEIEHIIG